MLTRYAMNSFIWAMITTLVTRMMLHLRKVAYSGPLQSGASFSAETAMSTRIVWARRKLTRNTSRTVSSRGANFGDHIDEDGEREEGFVLRNLRGGR